MLQVTIIGHVNLAWDQRCVSVVQPFHIIVRQLIIVPEIPCQPINLLAHSVFALLELIYPTAVCLVANLHSFHRHIFREIQVQISTLRQSLFQHLFNHLTGLCLYRHAGGLREACYQCVVGSCTGLVGFRN
jgi:hypothetical protein